MCRVRYTIYRNVCSEFRIFPQALWVTFSYFIPLVVREASPGLFGGELVRYQNFVVLVLLTSEWFEVPVICTGLHMMEHTQYKVHATLIEYRALTVSVSLFICILGAYS